MKTISEGAPDKKHMSQNYLSKSFNIIELRCFNLSWNPRQYKILRYTSLSFPRVFLFFHHSERLQANSKSAHVALQWWGQKRAPAINKLQAWKPQEQMCSSRSDKTWLLGHLFLCPFHFKCLICHVLMVSHPTENNISHSFQCFRFQGVETNYTWIHHALVEVSLMHLASGSTSSKSFRASSHCPEEASLSHLRSFLIHLQKCFLEKETYLKNIIYLKVPSWLHGKSNWINTKIQ